MSSPAPAGTPRVGLDLLEVRPRTYAQDLRTDVADLLDPPLGRVLDVGCGGGANAPLLRDRGATSLTGIELDPELAEAARRDFDEVVNASVDDEFPWPDEAFDTIICWDILEHLYDPWSTVRRLRRLLVPGGRLHVSIPNARHVLIWAPTLLKGSVAYEPQGVRDVTHIRFFTRRDALDMLAAGGYRVLRVDHPAPDSRKKRIAERLTGGRSAEFSSPSWFFLAERPAG